MFSCTTNTISPLPELEPAYAEPVAEALVELLLTKDVVVSAAVRVIDPETFDPVGDERVSEDRP